MIRFKDTLFALAVWGIGIPAWAKMATSPEYEQRSLETKLISVQTKIRSRLDESEQSLCKPSILGCGQKSWLTSIL